jgi:hypothetical protein
MVGGVHEVSWGSEMECGDSKPLLESGFPIGPFNGQRKLRLGASGLSSPWRHQHPERGVHHLLMVLLTKTGF